MLSYKAEETEPSKESTEEEKHDSFEFHSHRERLLGVLGFDKLG